MLLQKEDIEKYCILNNFRNQVKIKDIDIGIHSLISTICSIEESIHKKIIYKQPDWKNDYDKWV